MSAPPSPTSATPSADPGPPRNERGHLQKTIGETSGVSGCGEDGKDMCVKFVVTSIETSQECAGNYAEPPKGMFIRVEMNVETAPNLAEGNQILPYFNAGTGGWQAIKDDGYTVGAQELNTVAVYTCENQPGSIPSQLAPASKYQSGVILDAPVNTVAVVFDPYSEGNGWEWEVPSE